MQIVARDIFQEIFGAAEYPYICKGFGKTTNPIYLPDCFLVSINILHGNCYFVKKVLLLTSADFIL